MKKTKRLHTPNEFNSAAGVCIIVGAFFLTGYTVVCSLDLFRADLTGIVLLSVYVIFALTAYFSARKRSERQQKKRHEEVAMSTVMAQTVKELELPFVLTDPVGRIIWYNRGFSEMTKRSDSLFGIALTEFCQICPDEIVTGNELIPESERKPAVTKVGKKTYEVRCNPMRVAGKDYFISVFSDATAYYDIAERLEKETPVVAYIVIDNLDELASYVRVSSREAANEAEVLLKNWATDMNAIIREYDRDKYILIFHRAQLLECISKQFDILERVRDIHLGDSSMPITLSIGICDTGATLSDLETGARTALDMALQRGGDQVAYRSESGLSFFGGRTKNIQKKTKVLARVVAEQLVSLISNAGNVIIMGHRNPDFDSIGACVGLARLCMYCDVSPKIVIDKNNKSFLGCSASLLENDSYREMFIDPSTAMDLIRSDTLLVLADVNNFNILEDFAIVESVYNIAIIDHHRKNEEFKRQPAFDYIDPSASSACELVSEILEQCLPVGTLLKEEATVMLSGIMVDTNDFTRSTGTRTFAAALYLRGEGGNSEIAHTFFEEDLSDFSAEAKLSNNVSIYRDRIAITSDDAPDNGAGARVAASRAADKLLNLRNVDATFALVRIDETIHISARSNGAINVQLILEKLNGGGHFNVAGAQVSGTEMKDAMIRLKAAIDNYLDKL